MKKRFLPILTGIAFFALSLDTNAQMIPNGDFEQLASGGQLPEWIGTGGTITQRETIVVTVNGEPQEIKSNGGQRFVTLTNSQLISSIRTVKHAINTTPTGIRFQTMYFPQGADGFSVFITMTKAAQLDSNDNVITDSLGNAIIDTVLNTSTRIPTARFPWQTLTLNIPDSLYKGTPDSVTVTFRAGQLAGSTLALDDVIFINYAASEGPLSYFTGGVKLYPSPASNLINVNYTLNMQSQVKMDIYDVQGRVVKNVLNESQYNGEHNNQIDVSELKSGIYLLRINSNDKVETIKFTVE